MFEASAKTPLQKSSSKKRTNTITHELFLNICYTPIFPASKSIEEGLEF